MNTKKLYLTLVIGFTLVFAGCNIIQSFVNLSRLQFKLHGVTSISVAGVSLTGKKSLSDLNVFEIAKVTESFFKGSLPLTFTLDLAAVNPNTGSGGYARTDAQLKSLPFRLVVDNRDLVTGNIKNPVSIPGTGETEHLPIDLTIDLAKVIKDQGYESLLNLALQVSGVGSGSSNVSLYARPVVSTVLGDITYPDEIRIVDATFSK
ncbi:MAG: hypothetical protein J0L60_10135 [Ignavibacteria bacterium]|nr:hypothetical protein [Ignavibacteria bacterium]